MKQKVEVISSVNDTLLDEWDQLWKKTAYGHFFNSPAWFLACHDTNMCQDYKVYVQRKDGNLEAILPLVPQRKYGVTTMMSPGGEFVDKSSLLLAENAGSLALLQKQLVREQAFSLSELSQEQCNLFERGDEIRIKEASVNPYILLQQDPFIGVSKKQKSKVKNKIKKHESHLRYTSYKSDKEALELAFSLEERSYKKMKGKATFVSQDNRDFLKHVFERNKKNVIVDVLSYDGIPIICGIGFQYKKTYHAFYTSHDIAYRHLSPGKMLLFFLLQRLQKDGMEVFDFSRGKSTLKSEFTSLTKTQYTLSYATNYMTTLWWQAADKTYDSILENHILYGTYCQLKRLFY